MYIIVRDPLTSSDIRTSSLSGFVPAEPVGRSSLGVPLSEASASVRTAVSQEAQQGEPARKRYELRNVVDISGNHGSD